MTTDNVNLPANTGKAATDKVTYSGDEADVQLMRPVHVEGAEGARTVTGLTNDDGTMNVKVAASSVTALPVVLVDSGGDAIGEAVNGIDVDVTRLPALVAGSANIGDVDVASIAAGDNNIGNVDVVTLPALVAGSANIGDVDVLTLPADPLGANADALVAAGATGSISAKLRRISQSIEDLKTTAIVAGTANIGDVDVLTLPALVAGSAAIGKLAANDAVDIGDVTVNNATGSPVPVRIGDGTLQTSVVDETGSSAVDALAVGGGTPHDSVDSGNPLKMGFKAANAFPSAVANADRANGLSDLFGRQLITHIDPAQQVFKSYNDTASRAAASAQVVWDPTSGKRIAITSYVISVYGTTAGRIFLFFADDADLTYTAGTDQPLLVASYAPSTSAKPGTVWTGSVPIFCVTADRRLHYQNDAAISIDITIYGYEW